MPLVEKLNQFLQLMKSDFEHERRFARAAAHELRTPVAELRSLSAVAIRFSLTDDPDVQGFLGDIHSASIRMEKLVTTLLTLARAHHPAAVASPQIVPRGKVVRRLCTSLEQQAAARGVRFHIEMAKFDCGYTDPVLVELLCMNLLENAISHAAAGSVVTIIMARDGQTQTLSIENATDGTLDQNDLPHLTQQFWRKDSES